MQPRFDFSTWESLYYSKINGTEWTVPWPIESPMDIVKRELWIRDHPPSEQPVPVDYFVFGIGEPDDPSSTKFGGVPYRSRSKPWPGVDDEEAYEFFGQINFTASRDIVPDLPSDLLLIFLTWEDGAMTDDYYFEWGETTISDPMSADDVPEPPFGMVHRPAYCELHRTNEFSPAGHPEDDPFRRYSDLAVTKIGGVSDYFGDSPPDLPGHHLFTLCSTWTSKGRAFPFLNHHDPIPKPTGLGGSHMEEIFMLGDVGEAYFFLHDGKLEVDSRCH